MATDALVELARAGLRFHDLAFVDPGGILEVSSDADEIEGIRFELPYRQYLGLQSIGVDCEGEDVADIAEVELSSWWRNRADRFSNQRFFDFDHPSGLVVQTDLDDRPWIQVRFTRPLGSPGSGSGTPLIEPPVEPAGSESWQQQRVPGNCCTTSRSGSRHWTSSSTRSCVRNLPTAT